MEEGWLIESNEQSSIHGRPMYLSMQTDCNDMVSEFIEDTGMTVLWTSYHLHALRFAREVDAKNWADIVFGEKQVGRYEILQHEWPEITKDQLEDMLVESKK